MSETLAERVARRHLPETKQRRNWHSPRLVCQVCQQLWPCESRQLLDELDRLRAIEQAAREIADNVVNAHIWDCDCPSCARYQRLRAALEADR